MPHNTLLRIQTTTDKLAEETRETIRETTRQVTTELVIKWSSFMLANDGDVCIHVCLYACRYVCVYMKMHKLRNLEM